MAFKIIVAKEGKSIWSTDRRDVCLTTDKKCFKIGDSMESTSTDSDQMITHGIRANSLFMPYVSNDNTNWYFGGYNAPDGHALNYMDDDQFEFVFNNAGTNYYAYYVFYDLYAAD